MKWIWVLAVMMPGIGAVQAQPDKAASYAMIERVLPGKAKAFLVEDLAGGKDAFELESRGGRILLRGHTGVAIASALYYYLQEYCHCQITWNGSNLALPSAWPKVIGRVHKETPYTYRYYLNYCTFNYSMSWWDWPRWEKEIDWMALHGINMPLAITGEEYTWQQVYREMGFSDEELSGFFSGPAYFAWGWMGNLDGWGGPLPQHWIRSHYELQRKILQRERELGMKSVLPAFTGHVPAAFAKHFPGARLKRTNWKNGFADTYILDSQDSLFAAIGKRFLAVQTRLYGTDHLYSADTFNENEPPSDDPAYLGGLSAGLYKGMRAADPAAVWVMQGWLFYSDRKFWKAPQIKGLLDSVPDEGMILLDLAAEIEPVWKRTQGTGAGEGAPGAGGGGSSEGQTLSERRKRASFSGRPGEGGFYGKPWIWNMLNNFGGNVNLFGRMDGVAAGPALALADPAAGRLKGIGLTMEAIEQNPVIYELMMDHVWRSTPIDPGEWLKGYVRNRYGRRDDSLVRAWEILRRTAYNGKDIRDGAESIVTGRPTMDSTTVWTRTRLNYPPRELLPAWDLFVQAAEGSAAGTAGTEARAAAPEARAGGAESKAGGPEASAGAPEAKAGAPEAKAGGPEASSANAGNGTRAGGPDGGLPFKPGTNLRRLTDGFEFDLVDLTRQVLANYALPLQRQWVSAYSRGDSAAFGQYSAEFIDLISDMDRLLKTRKDFLLGPWIDAARSRGIATEEKNLYEMNARDLITLWGDANSPLHEYANRQWSGLLNDFYKVRWEKYFSMLRASRGKGQVPDEEGFGASIRAWEWEWVNRHDGFPSAPSGNSVSTVSELYKKYRPKLEMIYQ